MVPPWFDGSYCCRGFDKTKIEELLKSHFNKIPNPKPVEGRSYSRFPDQDNLSFSIVTDPEATGTTVSFYHRLNVFSAGKNKRLQASAFRRSI